MPVLLLPILLSALAVPTAQEPAPDPHRQFDFWIGEWSVQNRHIQPDATWRAGTRTRARITPVCNGSAILEEWAGPFRGTFMNGFSLRAFDPEQQDWALLLSWTVDGNTTFGQLRGSFRHGRGEFFFRSPLPDGGERIGRYSFSDALPQTVRWDSAASVDGGRTWETDWIMEFTRTREAEEVTQDELFAADWTEGTVSPHESARALDWLLGDWEGSEETFADASGAAVFAFERKAKLRSKLLNKDCLVLDVFATEIVGGWEERLTVRGFVPQRSGWESWSLSQSDTVLRRSLGAPGAEEAVFERELADGAILRETLRREGEHGAVITVHRVTGDDAEPQLLRRARLARTE